MCQSLPSEPLQIPDRKDLLPSQGRGNYQRRTTCPSKQRHMTYRKRHRRTVYGPIVETVNTIESIKIRKSPDLKSLKTLKRRTALKAPSEDPPSEPSDISNQLIATTMKSKMFSKFFMYLVRPSPTILTMTSIEKTTLNTKLNIANKSYSSCEDSG